MNSQAKAHQAAHFDRHNRSTDRLFLILMVVQYVGCIFATLLISPTTVDNGNVTAHPHLIAAILLGFVIEAPAVLMIKFRPGTAATRYTISVCQALMSSLLIHVTGGRIETHFHIFGSLAFLAFYRDWKVLVPATVVVTVDHFFRGIYFPMTIYGVPSGAEMRFLEHAGWVLFLDIFLTVSCLRSSEGSRMVAEKQAALEEAKEVVEIAVLKRTEELRQSELKKTAIFNNVLDGIVTFGTNEQVLEINASALKMFGLEASSEDLTIGCLVDFGNQPHTQVVGRLVEAIGKRPGGEEFPVELTITQVVLSGELVYTAVMRDQTERHQLQQRLNQATKLESLGQLSVGVAHEINTPNQYVGDNLLYVQKAFQDIRAYVAECQALEADAPKLSETRKSLDLEFALAEVPQAVNQALEGVQRIGEIVRALREFAHPGTSSFSTANVNSVIENTLAVTRNEWKYVATVHLDLDPHLPLIDAHPGELGQVFLNLIVNACHAIADARSGESLGTISIRTFSDEGSVMVEVSDDGTGIPLHVQHRIFDPFFTTKGVGIGSGQGLSVAHRIIVQNHSGNLGFDTEPGQGTTFRITLPIHQKEMVTAA